MSSQNYPNQYPKWNKNWKNLASKMGLSVDRIKCLELMKNQRHHKQRGEKDLKESIYHGAVIRALAVGFTMQSPSDHSDLSRTKNLVIYGQSIVFSEFWSDQ